ncbi:tyrosyl-tRNA synthetase [Aspergillus steynii IBT 23096]|uniref:Tyrosine--tRNA ligase n=1 Tax=Aspergillus steynii IBT 23096 TaxID=1392250 RepID=A0A2I2FW11_9EURO|nr:tyrosyl-tRNA synthetase [Aspergillus steynii IBT 23096]PLB44821.1 tyrosyl-tRNA synthetase [Aspergillus steynii IBT 23096]
MATMTADERFALISENLQEVLNPDVIKTILAEGRNPRVYWGTSPTGKPHCGYFVPAVKIAQLLAAGCEVTVLVADIHGFLDNLKAPIELVEHRSKYYEYTITAMLQAVGVSTEKLRFVLGSSYQKTPEYIMDVYKLCSMVSEHDAKKAGAEVVKQSDNSPLSGLLYPILQVLDEEYLKVDVQFGGLDQRKLFAASTEWQPKMGYKKRGHLINPLVPGLTGGKMSSSEEDSKIDLLESVDSIRKKIRKAQAAPQQTENNGVLSFAQYVLFPALALKTGTPEFRVSRERDGLEPLVYSHIDQMVSDYKNDVLTPQLLKPAVADALVELTAPIRAAFEASPEWQDVIQKAYPPPPQKEKKKKQKDKGSRYPGAGAPAADQAKPADAEPTN